MGSEQQFCLRWNNFQNNIISSFEYLRSEEDFVDVTLACEGRSLKAHKVILSACSPYFRDLLKTTPCQHPIIVLKDVVYEDLLSLMCFVYQGVVYIGQDRLTQFLRTAEFLQIKGLSEHSSSEHVTTGLSPTQSSAAAASSGHPTSAPVDSSTSPAFSVLPTFMSSLPALTPINNTTAVMAAAAMAAAASANRCASPQHRSSRSTPSPQSTSMSRDVATPGNGCGNGGGGGGGTVSSCSSAKRRKPQFPMQAYLPTLIGGSGGGGESPVPAADDGSGAPSQSSPVGEAAMSDSTGFGGEQHGAAVNNGDVLAQRSKSRVSGGGSSCSLGSRTCQEEALSLVSETSILRQRIEGCSTPTDNVCDNGSMSPGGSSMSASTAAELVRMQTPIKLEPNAFSMVGREVVGYPFFSQPGTSSIISTSVNKAQDGQQLAINSPTQGATPRFRQRWRCMQPSVCPHCLRTFSNAFNLKQHIVNVHTNGNELKCEVCGKVQKNKWYLRKHMVKSHNAPLRRVKLPDGTMVNTE